MIAGFSPCGRPDLNGESPYISGSAPAASTAADPEKQIRNWGMGPVGTETFFRRGSPTARYEKDGRRPLFPGFRDAGKDPLPPSSPRRAIQSFSRKWLGLVPKSLLEHAAGNFIFWRVVITADPIARLDDLVQYPPSRNMTLA